MDRYDDDELAAFLRSRRTAASAQRAGLPGRVLSRADLAARACISLPYLTRLEQGRSRHPSAQVVDSLGRALGLDQHEHNHLRRSAGLAPSGCAPAPDALGRGIREAVRAVAAPAFVLNSRHDVLAANEAARDLHAGYQPGTNLLRFLFLDPRAPGRLRDWESVACFAVGRFRCETIAQRHDPRVRALVHDLRRRSLEFRELWDRHETCPGSHLRLSVDHPRVGHLALHRSAFAVEETPGCTLTILSPEAEGDAAALDELARSRNTASTGPRAGRIVAAPGPVHHRPPARAQS